MVDKDRIESIKQLVILAKELGVAQLSYEDEDINVAFELEGCGHEHFEERFEPISIPQQKMAEEKKPASSGGNTFAVESPLSGTYYASPAPGADAFVTLGQIVNPGDTLCIVEAMKVMNEIVTYKKGRVVDMYYTSGQEVGAGSPLFVLEEI